MIYLNGKPAYRLDNDQDCSSMWSSFARKKPPKSSRRAATFSNPRSSDP